MPGGYKARLTKVAPGHIMSCHEERDGLYPRNAARRDRAIDYILDPAEN